uniref:Impact RWD domain protein n=1 Tax=Xenopus tropicalis TaxID=8364 RepID=A0A803J3W9_XENTR
MAVPLLCFSKTSNYIVEVATESLETRQRAPNSSCRILLQINIGLIYETPPQCWLDKGNLSAVSLHTSYILIFSYVQCPKSLFLHRNTCIIGLNLLFYVHFIFYVMLLLQVILPAEYPASSPPLYQLNAPWLRGEDRLTLANNLEEIYLQNLGENILYQWVEKIREFLLGKSQTSDPGPCLKSTSEETDVDDDCEIPAEELNESFKNSMLFGLNDSSGVEEIPPIIHGETITDRRSTFQAHLAPVVSPYQVKLILNKLYENKKIATATHNIYAYRIYIKEQNSFIQDCEDDGETAAGKRMLHLMQILDARDVMVVVSRWYGGILLGPDRFKHINNCARNILMEHKYCSAGEESSKQTAKSKKVGKECKKKADH